MTYTSSNGALASNKSFSASSTVSPIAILAGLVRHPLLSATDQVAVLCAIDATGSASVGDAMAALPGHSDPVGALQTLIEAGIIAATICNGVLDERTVLSRVPAPAPARVPAGGPDRDPNPVPPCDTIAANAAPPAAGAIIPLPDGIVRLPTRLVPTVLVGPGAARRAFGHLDQLRRPGVYILLADARAYVGMGSCVGRRVASGSQPIADVDSVITITDAHDGLSETDALVLERIMHRRVSAAREVTLINRTPDGAPIDPGRYRELDLLAATVCDGLAREGHLLVNVSARMVLAGPRVEADHFEPQRPFNAVPEGEVMDLAFGKDLVAMAARSASDDWLLLRGSDIRLQTVPSANASGSYLRAAWLQAGILQRGYQNKSYVLTRDVKFGSASAAMHFVVGSKGQGRGGWQPIDPDGGYDPQTPVLIAS